MVKTCCTRTQLIGSKGGGKKEKKRELIFKQKEKASERGHAAVPISEVKL